MDLVKEIEYVVNEYKEKDPRVSGLIKALLIKAKDKEVEQTKEINNISYREKLNKIYNNQIQIEKANLKRVTAQIQEKLKDKYDDVLKKADISTKERESLKQGIISIIRTESLSVNGITESELVRLLMNRLVGLDIIEEYYQDPEVEEIRFNEFNDIRIVVKGQEIRTDLAYDGPEELEALQTALTLRAQASGDSSDISQNKPFLRSRIGLNARLSLIINPVAIRPTSMGYSPDEPVMQFTIRKQKLEKITLEKLIEWGSLDEYGAYLIELLIANKISMIFYGGTGTGKSAGLGAALLKLPNDLRTISMAEIDEINPKTIDECRFIMDDQGNKVPNKNYKRAINSVIQWEFQDLNKHYINDLPAMQGGVNACLTMTPDCILIQEIKGGEIKDFYSAGLSDHQLLTSIHCADEDALALRTLIMFRESGVEFKDHIVLQQIPIATPIGVKFTRYRNGRRVVDSISEFLAVDVQNSKLMYSKLYQFTVDKQYLAEEEVKQDDGTVTKEVKLKIEGTHHAINFPSSKLIAKMRIGGLTDEQLKDFKRRWRNAPNRWTDNQLQDFYEEQSKI